MRRRLAFWLHHPCLLLLVAFLFELASWLVFSFLLLRGVSFSLQPPWPSFRPLPCGASLPLPSFVGPIFFSCSALISLRLACFSLSLFNSSSSLPRCLRHSLMYSLNCSSSSPFCFLALRNPSPFLEVWEVTSSSS